MTVTAIVCCVAPVIASASSTGSSDVSGSVGSEAGVDLIGQTFTVPAGTDTFFHRLDILKLSKGAAAGSFRVYVTAVDGSGLPTGPILFQSPLFSSPFGQALLRVYPNITVTAGTKYAFYTEETMGTVIGSSPPGTGGDVYAGGKWLQHRTTGWLTPPAIVEADIGFLADFNTGARDTLTSVSCPGPGTIGKESSCTATLVDAGNGSPLSGLQVVITGDTFADNCSTNASGTCSVDFTPTVSGTQLVFAQFLTDTMHLGSGSNTSFSTNKRNSAQSAGCMPTTLNVGETATCFVTVSDGDSGTKTTPTGATSRSSTGAGTFAAGGSCPLAPQTLGVAKCEAIAYTPTAPGSHAIISAYGGDATHLASTSASAGTLTVLAPGAAPVPGPDCGGLLGKISGLKKKLRKAPAGKTKKLKKKLRKLRAQATALGC